MTAIPRRPSPFADVRPAAFVAAGYAVAVLLWATAGAGLPGGRWLAVHLFTLGVLSNLVMALSAHFAQTLLHAPGGRHGTARLVVFNAGALAILGGLPSSATWLVGVGGTVAAVAVLDLYRNLRRFRATALPSRFTFAVRTYERACGAFLHGAVLGALLGTGVLPGSWAGGVRLAHLHTMVLGWGGLTLLATVVVFGPTVLRRRMTEGAETTAARWLPRAATGLSVAVLSLAASSAVPDQAALVLRLVAALGLLVYSAGVAAICRDVLTVAREAGRSAHGTAMTAACGWFPLVAVADALVVATGSWGLLDAVGIGLLLGVLAQAILASAAYLAPMLRGGAEPAVIRRRLDVLPIARGTLFNLGVAVLVAGAAVRRPDAGRLGWLIVALVVALQIVLTAAPRRSPQAVS